MTLKEYEKLVVGLDGVELYNFIKENWEIAALSERLQDERNKKVNVVFTKEMSDDLYQKIMKRIEMLGKE